MHRSKQARQRERSRSRSRNFAINHLPSESRKGESLALGRLSYMSSRRPSRLKRTSFARSASFLKLKFIQLLAGRVFSPPPPAAADRRSLGPPTSAVIARAENFARLEIQIGWLVFGLGFEAGGFLSRSRVLPREGENEKRKEGKKERKEAAAPALAANEPMINERLLNLINRLSAERDEDSLGSAGQNHAPRSPNAIA